MNQQSHGIMFHHFHGDGHPVSQGSLSADNFCALLNYVMATKKILSAEDYLQRHLNNTLCANETCITFDDGLLCQFQIAKPILDKFGLKAFFFIHSLPFFGDIDKLELYRYFRNTAYPSIDHFYDAFFYECEQKYPQEVKETLSGYDVSIDRKEFPFYSNNDKKFRFLRATVLGSEKYDEVMKALFHAKKFNKEAVSASLYMTESQIQALNQAGHIIGLHSFSHPVSLHTLTEREQENEYAKNFEHLKSITGTQPRSVSHPCGKYNDATLRILDRMGISLGFAATMDARHSTHLTVPREDSANLMRMLPK